MSVLGAAAGEAARERRKPSHVFCASYHCYTMYLIKYWRWCLGEVVERFDVVTVYKYDL